MISKTMSEAEKTIAHTELLNTVYSAADANNSNHIRQLLWLLKDGTFLKRTNRIIDGYDVGRFHVDVTHSKMLDKFSLTNKERYSTHNIGTALLMGDGIGAIFIAPPEESSLLPKEEHDMFTVGLVVPPSDRQLAALFELGKRVKLKLSTFGDENRQKELFSPETITLHALKEARNKFFSGKATGI